MEASAVSTGKKVIVAAADDFYAFIDGWHGKIRFPCWRAGYVIVVCDRSDGLKEFLIPVEQLMEDK
jgi:hypothetical protein